MTISLTYDDTVDIGRVQVSFTGYSTDADYALVERSTDQITWTTVRGGSTVPLTAGAGSTYDYEFVANALNYYRVTAVDTADPFFVATGTTATGNNTSVSPGIPAGIATGDLMILHASIRNSGTGTVNVPAGWTAIQNTANVLIAGRMRQAGDVAPTVTFNGGAANEDTSAAIMAFRGATFAGSVVTAQLLNSSAQDVLSPGISYGARDTIIRFGWKQDDATSVSLFAWNNSLYNVPATAGNDSDLFAVGYGSPVAGTFPSQVISVTGGAAAISRSTAVTFPKIAFTNQEINSITPAVAYYRIKNPSRPSLNIRVVPTAMSEITRTSRTGVFNVLGRTLPVTVSDVMTSRVFTLEIDVNGYSLKDDMDNRLSLGEPMFLQPPTQTGAVPTCYFVIDGDCVFTEDAVMSGSYTVTIPCREVAKPGSTVYGDTYIWNDVVTNYATWTDVLAAVSTWSNLIDKISTNSVIVP